MMSRREIITETIGALACLCILMLFIFYGVVNSSALYIYVAIPFLWVGIFLLRKDPELEYHKAMFEHYKQTLAEEKKKEKEEESVLDGQLRGLLDNL